MDTGPEPFSEDLPPQSTSGDTYGETGGRAANRGWRRRRTGREPAEQQAQADRFPPWGQERGLRYYPDAGVAPIEVRDLLEYEPFSRFFTPGSRVVVGRAEDADVYGTRDVPSVHVKGRWATCWVAGVEA